MILKVLVANRGEIACRIIQTCQIMGFATVAVYSDADHKALHVKLADEAVYIGTSNAADSYLNGQTIIEAALRVGANAIHPGYGFLAENPAFAYSVKVNDIVWIGPPPETIEAMGDKAVSKMILQDVPFVPGYFGDDQSENALLEAADTIGYPVMVKATAGGGGKGMRLVTQPEEMREALRAAKREAQQAFGNATLMLEKAIINPRHIEVQIIGDQYGNLISLGERECSIQRRHQKIIEETPSTALTATLRQQICDVAIMIGKQLGYYNAGTVEFLLDASDNFYFMEMNTRLQVEHPVTEEVYGIDLVRWQLEIARGTKLHALIPNGRDLIEFSNNPHGHAIEVRIYAEDPNNYFLPSIGEVALWQHPSNIRVDSGIQTSDTISTHYDPMIAKVISTANTRLEAIRKLNYALSQTTLHGMKNNIDFLQAVLMNDEHLGGIIDTQFLERHHHELVKEKSVTPYVLIAVALAKSHDPQRQYWRNNNNRAIQQSFTYQDETHVISIMPQKDLLHMSVGEHTYVVSLASINGAEYVLIIDGHRQKFMISEGHEDVWWVRSMTGHHKLTWQSPLPLPTNIQKAEGSLLAPMPGQVIQVMVTTGQTVAQGTALMILEAMKMEHRIDAPYDGTITEIFYKEGDTVKADSTLLELKQSQE